ncbi:hypothetical protein G9A89_012139 [Geosiphon pyriformis]|nr:hypothetical protein G9A89_012139 [Geosiphon pyriformis]
MEYIKEEGLVSPKQEPHELTSDFEYEEDDEEADDLELKNIVTKAWLVKPSFESLVQTQFSFQLPKFLSERWLDQEQEDKDLGFVRIYEPDSSTPGKIKLLLSDTDAHADIPKEYDLTITNPDVKDSYCFYEKKDSDKENGAVSMQATIHHQCFVTPIQGTDYSRKLRERTIQAGQPKRHIKMIDDAQNRQGYVPPGKKFGELLAKKAKVSMEQKTTRMPKDDLLDLLFQAFEQYAYWTLKGLKDYVKQPESYLKEVLTEIAILDKRGSYNNCYHLKTQYKVENHNVNDAIAPEAPTTTSIDRENEDSEGLEYHEDGGGGDDLDDADLFGDGDEDEDEN